MGILNFKNLVSIKSTLYSINCYSTKDRREKIKLEHFFASKT